MGNTVNSIQKQTSRLKNRFETHTGVLIESLLKMLVHILLMARGEGGELVNHATH